MMLSLVGIQDLAFALNMISMWLASYVLSRGTNVRLHGPAEHIEALSRLPGIRHTGMIIILA
jgi:predicted GTPase